MFDRPKHKKAPRNKYKYLCLIYCRPVCFGQKMSAISLNYKLLYILYDMWGHNSVAFSLLFIQSILFSIIAEFRNTMAITAICWWVLTPQMQTWSQRFLWPLTLGCRGAIVMAEARSSDHPALTRRCVIMKLPDFTLDRYEEAQRQNAAAVLILLPSNLSAVPQEVIQVTPSA